jgi:hypothetical protein
VTFQITLLHCADVRRKQLNLEFEWMRMLAMSLLSHIAKPHLRILIAHPTSVRFRPKVHWRAKLGLNHVEYGAVVTAFDPTQCCLNLQTVNKNTSHVGLQLGESLSILYLICGCDFQTEHCQ